MTIYKGAQNATHLFEHRDGWGRSVAQVWGTWIGAVSLHRLDSLNASKNLPKEKKKTPPAYLNPSVPLP